VEMLKNKEGRRKEGGLMMEGGKQLLQGRNVCHKCKISEKITLTRCLGFGYS